MGTMLRLRGDSIVRSWVKRVKVAAMFFRHVCIGNDRDVPVLRTRPGSQTGANGQAYNLWIGLLRSLRSLPEDVFIY